MTGKNLRLDVKVVGESGGVAGAQVAVQITRGVQKWNFTGSTNSSGIASFVLTKASAGFYVTSVTAVTLAGYTWDTAQGLTSASYTLSSGGKPAK